MVHGLGEPGDGMEDCVCAQEAGLENRARGCDSAQDGQSTIAARIEPRPPRIQPSFPHAGCGVWWRPRLGAWWRDSLLSHGVLWHKLIAKEANTFQIASATRLQH